MTNRETLLLTEANKLLPAGVQLDVELAKYGGTRTQQLVQFLEAHNEERRSGASLRGFFTGAFESKKEHFWRIIGEDRQSYLLNLNGVMVSEPAFCQKVNITNMDVVHKKISNRFEYTLTYQSKADIMAGSITDIVIDLNDAEPGYGLVQALLFRVEQVTGKDKKTKPIIGEDRVNLKITICGSQPQMGGKARFASGFVNSIEDLLALLPAKDVPYVDHALKSGQDQAVINALGALCSNKDVGMAGANLVIFGLLKAVPATTGDKIFYNMGVYKVLNLDNYGENVQINQQFQQFQPAPQAQMQPIQNYTPPAPVGTMTPSTYYMPPQTAMQPMPVPPPMPQVTAPPAQTTAMPSPAQFQGPQSPQFQPPMTPQPQQLAPVQQYSIDPRTALQFQASQPSPIIPPAQFQAQMSPLPPVQQFQAPPVAPGPVTTMNMEDQLIWQIRQTIYQMISQNPQIKAMEIMTQVMSTLHVERPDIVDAMNWLVNNGYVGNKDRSTYVLLKAL